MFRFRELLANRSRLFKVCAVVVTLAIGTTGVGIASAASASKLQLVYSAGADLSTPMPLSHATIPSTAHVFLGSPAADGLTSVSYYVDDAAGAGTPITVSAAPFDMGAINVTEAGVHTVLAVATATSGKTYEVFARFLIGAGTGAATTTDAGTNTGTTTGAATPAAGGTGTAATTGAAATGAMLPTGNIPGQWKLTWNDEFNTNALDTSKWSADSSAGGNNEDETACFQPSAVSQSEGSLNISLTDEGCKDGGRQYVGGQVRTSFSQTYGFFEARMYIPGANGKTYNFPAFWLVPGEKCWPTGGEIDIMETIDGGAKASYGNGSSCGNVDNGWPHADPGGGDWTGWHTFAVDWDPSGLTLYYDGKKVGDTITNGVSSTPMNILIDNVSRPMGGETVAGVTLKTDYVRVWSKQ